MTPGYAEALGLRLASGRFFTDADGRGGTLATIVNEEFVRQHLAVPQVTGLRLPRLIGGDGDGAVPAEIVGVVANVLKDGNDKQPQPELYFVNGAGGERIPGSVNLVIRTAGEPRRWRRTSAPSSASVDRDVVVDRIEPLATSVAASLDAPRFAAGVMGSFAGVAMLLAGIGLFGALSYSVAQRNRELAVRSALGARRRDLVRLVLGEGLLVVVPGIAIGMLGAIAFAQLMRGLLFGVTPLDTVAFLAAPGPCRDVGPGVPRPRVARGGRGSRAVTLRK